MRQKYEIVKDTSKKSLRIREYAVIDKRLNNVKTEMLRPEDYAMLHEETYDSKRIKGAISNGMIDLVSTLRTPIFFPDANNISIIAESIVKLYDSKNKNSIEVVLNNGDGHGLNDSP